MGYFHGVQWYTSVRNFYFIALGIVFLLGSCSKGGRKKLTTTAEFDSVLVRGSQLNDAGQSGEAMQYVTNAHNSARRLSLADEMNYYTWRNIEYGKRGDYNRSIAITDSMLSLLASSGERDKIKQWQAVAYNAKADALFAQGLYNDAYSYYFKAKQIASELNDPCSRRTFTYSLAMILFRQHRFAEAANNFKDAYAESEQCGLDFNLFYFRQEILDNIGLCYSALRQYDSAKIYYAKAERLIRQNAGHFPHKQNSVYTSALAVVYGNMAEVYARQKQYDTAKAFYNRSIAINLQKGYTNTDAVIAQAKLADLYHVTGDRQAEKRLLDQMRVELDTIHEPRARLMWYKQMWQYHESLGDSAGAYRFMRTYVAQNDSFEKSHRNLLATDFNTQIKDLEKEYRISLLVRDRKSQRTYLLIAISTTLLAVAVIFLFAVWLRKTKQHLKNLKELHSTIREQKSMLEQTLAELRARDTERSRILRAVAHDVMSPINAIIALTDIMLSGDNGLNDEDKEILGLIKDACINSQALSKDILEASNDLTPDKLQRSPQNICELLRECADFVALQAKPKQQQIIVNCQDITNVNINRPKMARAINNILSNAVKFSHHKGVITVNAAINSGYLRISVADKGVGIPEKFRPYIFDMFTEAKATGTAGETPHGLGLSISQQIVKAHNGNISFISEEGKGSTFYIEIPLT